MGTSGIALTGANGFIGRHLVNLMSLNGSEHKRLSFRQHDYAEILRQMRNLKAEGVTNFLNLGWPASSTHDYKNSEENANASKLSLQLAEACVETGIRFFGVGSPAELWPGDSEYAKRKSESREEVRHLIEANKVTWLRPHLVFDSASWPKLVRDAASGIEVLIRDNSRQNFIHVEDVASGIYAAVMHGLSGEVDILSGKPIRPSELLEALGYRFRLAPDISKERDAILWKNDLLFQTGWRAMRTEEILGTHQRGSGNLKN